MLLRAPFLLSILLIGAVGGASLGLASRASWRRLALLALLGSLGLVVGVSAAVVLAAAFGYSSLLLGGLVGATVGASLGTASGDRRSIALLGAAGAFGFGVGFLAGNRLREALPAVRGVGTIAVTGIVGGAALGAALGYLERRGSSDA